MLFTYTRSSEGGWDEGVRRVSVFGQEADEECGVLSSNEYRRKGVTGERRTVLIIRYIYSRQLPAAIVSSSSSLYLSYIVQYNYYFYVYRSLWRSSVLRVFRLHALLLLRYGTKRWNAPVPRGRRAGNGRRASSRKIILPANRDTRGGKEPRRNRKATHVLYERYC